jgi:hypothetical protein
VKGIDPKIIVTIIIIMAVVLFSIMLAAGALGPVGDLLSKQKITDILGIFGAKSS